MSPQTKRRTTAIFAAGILLGFGLALIGFNSIRYKNSATTSHFMSTQRGHLLRLDGASADGRVVFLGSSSFQGLDHSAVTPFGLNLGLGGDTLAGLIERSRQYRSLHRARAIVINIGLNDLLQDCTATPEMIDQLWQTIPASIPLIVTGLQSLNPQTAIAKRCEGRINSLIAGYNRALEQACLQYDKCQFAPHPITEQAHPTAWENDGIHLSRSAYRKLHDSLRKVLRQTRPDSIAADP